MKNAHHSVYRGCNVYRNCGPYGLWESYVRGVFIAADTLAGIRQFIRETLAQQESAR